MATEVYEDSLELEIGLIESENLRPDGGEAHRRSYPYPLLHPVPGRTVKREFLTVVIENPYLRATFVPELGGRLLRLFDKTESKELLPTPENLIIEEGGPRGATLNAGVQLLLSAEERLTALANCPFMLDPPSDDEEIGVWFFGLERNLSFHAHWTMPPLRSEIHLQVRCLNRTLETTPYNGGVMVPAGERFALAHFGHPFASAWLAWYEDHGIAFAYEGIPLDLKESMGDRLVWRRFPDPVVQGPDPRNLSPHQIDTWKIKLYPVAGIAQPTVLADDLIARIELDDIHIRSFIPAKPAKLLLDFDQSPAVEAALMLDVKAPIKFSGAEVPPTWKEIAVLDSRGSLLVRSIPHRPQPASTGIAIRTVGANLQSSSTTWPSPLSPLDQMPIDALLRMTFDAALRPGCYVAAALQSSKARHFEQAADFVEAALLYNAEDPLAWWLRAVALRHAGRPVTEENPELLNAHYLAPLEPVLRAEGWLSQPIAPGREPAALLKPLAEFPEHFLEVACLLIDAGLIEDATRWIDEALRHVDMTLLRYLLAHLYLEHSRMQVEAAQQVAQAAKLPDGPPYPYRRAEVRAVTALHAAFPSDARLATMAELCQFSPAG